MVYTHAIVLPNSLQHLTEEEIYSQVMDFYKKIGDGKQIAGIEKFMRAFHRAIKEADENNKELDTYLREMKKIGAQTT
jgi:hypothetical protein